MSLQKAIEILERQRVKGGAGATQSTDLNAIISMLDSPVFMTIEILERQRVKGGAGGTQSTNLNAIISMLDSPVFQSLLQIQQTYVSEPTRCSPLLHHGNHDPPDDESVTPRAVTPEEIVVATEGQLLKDSREYSSYLSEQTNQSDYEVTLMKLACGRHIETITLNKVPNTSLGFSVVKAKDEQGETRGIFVQQIKPDSIADIDGRLEKDDQILAINEQILVDVSHEQAIRILQSADQVQLVVARGEEQVAVPGQPPSPEQPPQPPPTHAQSDMLNTEWTQIEIIELINDGTGLGFGIVGGRSTGVVVKTILPGGVADINGHLRSGDHILYINDVNVRGMTSEQVASVLRQSGSHVRLIIARSILEPPLIQDYQAPIIPTSQLDEQLENLFISDSQEQLDRAGLSGSENSVNTQNSPSGMPPSYYLSDVHIHNSLTNKSPESETFEVILEKDNTGLGITIAGVIGGEVDKDELCGIFVKGITEDSPAAIDGRILVNDHIIEVDSRSLWGCTNQEAVEVLRLTGHSVKLKLIRYLRGPKYEQLQIHQAQGTIVPKDMPMMNHIQPSQPIINGIPETNGFNMIKTDDDKDENDNDDFFSYSDEDFSGDLGSEVETTIKACWEPIIGEDFDVVVAQLSKFQESAGLGISLEGTVDIENGVEVRPHHYIRAILQHGPVGMNGKLKSGDELLEVNGKRILGLNHVNVVAILKKLPKNVRIVCARRKRAMSEVSATEYSTDQFSSSSFSMGVTPAYDRMVKSKSDMTLTVGDDTELLNAENKAKSRSLEPLTGLAVWSPEPVVIELVKGDKGLGFSILDYKDPLNQSEVVIVIRSLVPRGVAQLDGRLIPGDRLMFVNDADLENASLDQAVQALKGAPVGVVRIGVAKPLPVSQSFHNQVNENEFGSDEKLFNDIDYQDRDIYQSEIIVPQTDINIAYPRTHSSTSNSDSDIEELKSRLKLERDGHFSSSSSDDDDTNIEAVSPHRTDATNYAYDMLPHTTPNHDANSPRVPLNYPPSDPHIPPIIPPPPIEPHYRLSQNIDDLSEVQLSQNGVPLSHSEVHRTEVRGTEVVTDNASVPTRRVSHDAADITRSQNTIQIRGFTKPEARLPVPTLVLTGSPAPNSPKPALPPKPYTLLQTIQSKNSGPTYNQSASQRDSMDQSVSPKQPVKAARSSPPMKPLRKGRASVEGKRSPSLKYLSPESSFDAKEDVPPLPTTSPPPPLEPTKLVQVSSPSLSHELKVSIDSSTFSSDNANTSDLKGTSVRSTPQSMSPALSPLTSPRVHRTLSGSSVDTIPSSFEHTIKVNKGSEPLGMSLEVVDKGVNGCAVRSLSPGGSIVNDGRIQVGHHITNLNYENMKRITNAQAHAVIRRASLLSSTFIRITYITSDDVTTFHDSNNSPSHVCYPAMTSPNPSLSPVHRVRTSSQTSSPLSSPAKTNDPPSPSTNHRILPDDKNTSGDRRTSHDRTPSDHHTFQPDDTLTSLSLTQSFTSPSPPPLPDSAPPSLPVSVTTPLPSVQSSSSQSPVKNNSEITSEITASFQSSVFEDITPLQTSESSTQSPPSHPPKYKSDAPPPISEHAWGPPQQVQLTRREGQSLGISIVGGRADSMGGSHPENVISGIFIKHVLPDSPAGENGTLKTGDRIIMVNGNDLTDATHDQAVEVIRNAKNPVQFVVQSLVDSTFTQDPANLRKSVDTRDGPLVTISANPDQNNEAPTTVPENDSDDEEGDAFGYTIKKLQRKYGELPGELHLIELEHSGDGLGISLAGNKDRGTMSTFIAGLQPESTAEIDGRLHVGDELLEVNGHTLYGRSHLNASAIIKGQSASVIKLVLLRREDALEQMAVKPLRLSPSIPAEHESSLPMQNNVKISPAREIKIIPQPKTPESQLPGSYESVKTVVLHKRGTTSLGLAISEGNSDGKPGIFVESLTPGGTAEKDGNLQTDDQILEVDDHSLINVNYEKAITILRNTKGLVKLTISKCGDRPNPPQTVINIQDTPGESSSDPPQIIANAGNSDPATCNIMPGVETTIEIEKGRKGLGLSIVGGADTLLGAIIIHEVYEDGAAARDGRLRQGDNIMDVNHEDLRNVSHERAIQVLRQTPATVRMTVFRDDAQLKDDDMLDVFTIELLKKPGKGLGISIVGKRNDVGVFISDVVKGGLAEADGRLMQGDQILTVNDTDLRQASQDQAAVLLKTLMGKVTLTIGRLKAGSKASSRRNSGGAGSGVHKSNSSASSKTRAKHSKKRDVRNNTIRTVKLERDGVGSLGLSIAGGEGSPMGDVPVVIADINPEGPAARCAKLKVGDYILSINGTMTDGMTHSDAVQLLKNSTDNLTLKVVHGEELPVNINNGTSRQTSMDLTPVPIGPVDVDYSPESVRTIYLQKGSEGLGFTIVGGYGSPHGDLPIYVKNVFSKGAAADGNELKRGDQIMSVSGHSLEGLTHEEAVNILKQTKGEVTLEIAS